MVMTKLGMPCTIHHACDCLDLLGVLCELGTCLQLLGEPARIGASEPLGERFSHQLGLIERGPALRR